MEGGLVSAKLQSTTISTSTMKIHPDARPCGGYNSRHMDYRAIETLRNSIAYTLRCMNHIIQQEIKFTREGYQFDLLN
jgi:hypothetical protein